MEGSTFNSSIQRIFDSWTVLKLAVEHGFGGADSEAISKWMVDATEQWFTENSNVEPFEVEEVLESMLNTELNTVADDGSLPQVSSHLCTCYNLLQQGKALEVESLLSKLPKAQVEQCIHRHEDTSSDSEQEMDMTGACNDASASQRGHSSENAAATDAQMEDDDGWTKVARKGKKR